jgi:hypothetical protein
MDCNHDGIEAKIEAEITNLEKMEITIEAINEKLGLRKYVNQSERN